MRIPFDLIAAIICLEGVTNYFSDKPDFPHVTAVSAIFVWACFLLLTWFLNELVTRNTEWRTRFGTYPSGLGTGRHPVEIHSWCICAAQCLTVLAYTFVLWKLKWPKITEQWPAWFGLNQDITLGSLTLSKSVTVGMLLNLTPFMLAMILAWAPQRRLYSGSRRRHVSLLKYVAFEAKLSWLPLILSVAHGVVMDTAGILPDHYTEWTKQPGWDIALPIMFMIILAFVAMPKLVIWLWKCGPLPEGETKVRLEALIQRSGVKTKNILLWGTPGSGMLNACVLGPWARFRYVLISPQLLDELTMEETEAVLAHELGHARYGHLTLLVVMFMCLLLIIDPLSLLLPMSWQKSPIIPYVVMIVFVVLYFWSFFGSIMRQCEREADLASAELLGTPEPLITALEKLARITGNIRNIWCWHHGSIAERVNAVQQLSADPEGSRRLHARLKRVRMLLATLTLVGLGAELAIRLIGL